MSTGDDSKSEHKDGVKSEALSSNENLVSAAQNIGSGDSVAGGLKQQASQPSVKSAEVSP